MKDDTRGLIYAGIAGLCWGVLPIGLKVADQRIDPMTIVWIRFIAAFLMLAAWQLAFNPSSFRILRKPPLLLFGAAIGLMWNYFSFMLGIHHITPGNAQIFIQFGPILLATSGFLFFRERITRLQIAGYGIALTGFAFFYRDQLFAFTDSQSNYTLGILIILSSAVAWSVYAILQKILVSKYSADSLNLFLFGVPSLIFLPLIHVSPLTELTLKWWILLFFLGLNTFIAYTFMAKALQYTDANKVSIIIIMNPILTFIAMGALATAGVTWVSPEKFSVYTAIGILLVLAGALLVIRKQQKSSKYIEKQEKAGYFEEPGKIIVQGNLINENLPNSNPFDCPEN